MVSKCVNFGDVDENESAIDGDFSACNHGRLAVGADGDGTSRNASMKEQNTPSSVIRTTKPT